MEEIIEDFEFINVEEKKTGEDEEEYDEEESEEEETYTRSTLEKVAVTKAALEDYYQNLFRSISERSERRETLELKISKKGLQKEKAERWRKRLEEQETEFIRMRRLRMTSTSFEKIKIIGRGAFGEVSLVRKRGTDKLYAMKRISKREMLKEDKVEHVRCERSVLVDSNKLYINNPWITKLYYSFQDQHCLYLIMEYVAGGDMMTWLINENTFSENTTKFYIAETILAIESIHKIGYIHRDIKPDNLLVDINGHIKLADFGLSSGFTSNKISELWKILKDESKELKPSDILPKSREQQIESWKKSRKIYAYSFIGTPDYMAPEVLEESGYGQEADWWSVGCIMYEMLVGYAPFCSETKSQTYRKIMNYKDSLQFPDDCEISVEAKDLIMKLICKSEERLGTNGSQEIKKHPFFNGIDWDNIRKVDPPFVPLLDSPLDSPYFDVFEEIEQNEIDSLLFVDPSWKRTLTAEDLPFIGYTYKSFYEFEDNFGTMLRSDKQNY